MKKLFAFALVLALLAGVLPLAAFAAEETAEGSTGPESAVLEGDTTQEDLFAGYVDSIFYPNPDVYSIGTETAGARLTGLEAEVYNALVPFIKDIAVGKRANTVITLGKGTADYPSDVDMDLYGTFADFNRREVVLALRSDFPYEMYWFDYYTGFAVNYSYKTATGEMTRLTFKFTVASVFRGSDKYIADLSKTSATKTAANNARAIADSYAGQLPYYQYLGFKDKICSLVSYDYDAPGSNSSIDNGPWQLIRVFDGNPSTNVVCAGYAKAYQYLCDLAKLSCYYVSGYTSGNHAWNIVTLDGKNYLVDVTNCDEGMWGQDGSLFLAGGSGSPQTNYVIPHQRYSGHTLTYTYDDDMLDLWGTAVLTLAPGHYVLCNHSFSSYDSKLPTEEEEGIRVYTCSKCGYSYEEAIPKVHIHSYTPTVIQEPTCDEEGQCLYTCGICGHSYTGSLAALGHDMVSAEAVQPTCTTPGKTVCFYCSVCGEVLLGGNEIPAKGHTPLAGQEIPATCTSPGMTAGSNCAECGISLAVPQEIPALGHDAVLVSGIAPSCLEPGKNGGSYCDRCGVTISGLEEIPALGHNPVPGEEDIQPTCTKPGKTSGVYCGTCNVLLVTPGQLPALGHSPVAGEGIPAGCTSTGMTGGSYCSTCGETLLAPQVIPALGHTVVVDPAVAPTCTTPGKTEGSHCAVCYQVFKEQETVPAGHAFGHEYDYKCDLCGETREVDMTRPMVDMFRMYDPNSGEHFYTGSTVERENLVKAGWHYEGVGFTFPLTTGDPVHRLYDPRTGEHLYTMDKTEMNTLLAAGWDYEGIAFNSGFENEVPQYRLHNPNATRGAYHFTASREERNFLINQGWEYQGIGWYSCGAMP